MVCRDVCGRCGGGNGGGGRGGRAHENMIVRHYKYKYTHEARKRCKKTIQK